MEKDFTPDPILLDVKYINKGGVRVYPEIAPVIMGRDYKDPLRVVEKGAQLFLRGKHERKY